MAKRPCRECGRLLIVGRNSLPNPKCRPCRQANPVKPPPRLRPSHTCRHCGTTIARPKSDDPACRACHSRMKRRPHRTPEHKARTRKRLAARARLAAAARGTRGGGVWTNGACDDCGQSFTLHGAHARRYCSDHCTRRAKRGRRTTREHGGTGWRWSDFMRIARQFGYCCAYCGTKPDRLDPDHVVPLARGGDDSLSNLLPTCMPCNSDKRDLLLHEWRTDRERRGLEPRHTEWSDDDRRVWHLALLTVAA